MEIIIDPLQTLFLIKRVKNRFLRRGYSITLDRNKVITLGYGI